MRSRGFLAVMFLICASAASSASAQIIEIPKLEIRPWIGARIPTGPQGDIFRTAPVYGAQAAIEMTRTFHMIGTLAWSPGQSRMDVVDQDVDVFEYDLGVEYNFLIPLSDAWDLKPFAGGGAGARTYLYGSRDLESSTPLTAYGSLGTELQRGRAAFRIESRGYLHGFSDPRTEDWDSLNDVGVAVGFAYHFPRP